jgi:hypothetical protein
MPDDSDRIKTQHGVMSWDDLLVHCRNTAESFRQRGQRALSANDLRKNVSEIADDLSALYTYMVSDPSRVISGGRHLTETEYYLFRAYANTMVKLPDFRLWPGLQDLGEYGVWQMLQYEDEHVISFINVMLPRFGGVVV